MRLRRTQRIPCGPLPSQTQPDAPYYIPPRPAARSNTLFPYRFSAHIQLHRHPPLHTHTQSLLYASPIPRSAARSAPALRINPIPPSPPTTPTPHPAATTDTSHPPTAPPTHPRPQTPPTIPNSTPFRTTPNAPSVPNLLPEFPYLPDPAARLPQPLRETVPVRVVLGPFPSASFRPRRRSRTVRPAGGITETAFARLFSCGRSFSFTPSPAARSRVLPRWSYCASIG